MMTHDRLASAARVDLDVICAAFCGEDAAALDRARARLRAIVGDRLPVEASYSRYARSLVASSDVAVLVRDHGIVATAERLRVSTRTVERRLAIARRGASRSTASVHGVE